MLWSSGSRVHRRILSGRFHGEVIWASGNRKRISFLQIVFFFEEPLEVLLRFRYLLFFQTFFFSFLGGQTNPYGAIRPQKWRSLPFYHMRRSSRNGLIAIRPTAASHTLLAKCQSCGIRAAKITWSRGSTGSSFTCEHTSRGIFPHDLFSLLESLGSLEMWRILRISLVTKLKSLKTKVLEIGNQSYFLGKKACH